MQTASPGSPHDARGSTAFAENTPRDYYNLEFDDEIELRQQYLDWLFGGTSDGTPEHGSEDYNDPRLQNESEQHEQETRFVPFKWKNIRGTDGTIRRVKAYRPVEVDCWQDEEMDTWNYMTDATYKEGMVLCVLVFS